MQNMTQAFPPLPRILRVFGEAFSTVIVVNSDLLWRQYEQALDDAQPRSAAVASTIELFL